MAQLILEVVTPEHSEAASLILELNTELDALYHPDENHFSLDPHEVEGERGTFLLARVDGEPAGCGAVRMSADGRGEIKRMYVRPSWRGHGVGSALLARLELEAIERDARSLVLEMGDCQPAAEALYRRSGFATVPCWGAYLATPGSLCLEKVL